MTTLKALRLALKKALWTGVGGMRQAKTSGEVVRKRSTHGRDIRLILWGGDGREESAESPIEHYSHEEVVDQGSSDCRALLPASHVLHFQPMVTSIYDY